MTGLYVHIPFCSVKCFYCDFAAYSGQKKQVERYLAALETEAALLPPRAPKTLYIGGGTPSELEAGQIADLFVRLRRAYGGGSWTEVTFEGNPESLDEAKLATLAAQGVTRLSIGLQTADDALLKSVGRRHTAADFARVFRAARAAGIPALSVDLMFGLPGQTLESLAATLDFTLDLSPEHLSIYGLQVEDRTLFARRGVEEDSELGRAMFERVLDRLAGAGYEHYEVSNFAKPGCRSAHNLNYWARGEYLGLGCSAASFLGGVRTTNEERLLPYLDAVESGRRATVEAETPSGRELLGEEAFLGLRLVEGFVPSPALRAAFAGEWALLLARGLVEEAAGRWRLTRDGLFVANDAFKAFVPPYDREEATA
ncbi:MAG: radical SAM family heme chaperone HemW [Elusimicrobiota bacterium]|nr:radical SAM family heme chaperone HemW [Elusimicrobiota bacterium]